MNIREQEDELFSVWSCHRDGFVADGVVSEVDYLASKIKLCFILKEVNDPDGGDWDLRDFLFEGARHQTWDNVTRWVKSIKNLPKEIYWNELSNISELERSESLKSISVINLKKTPGTHTADYASMETVANEDKRLIQKQFSIYNPDITICGGTAELFKYIAGYENAVWKMTTRGIWWFERENGKYVISYNHPEARVHKPLLIYGLLDAIKEICPHFFK